jgi:hypothetical protein
MTFELHMKMEDGENEAARKKQTIIDTPSNAFSCQNTYTYTNLHKSDVKPIVRGPSHLRLVVLFNRFQFRL